MPPPVFIATKPIDPPRLGHNNYQGFKKGEREILPKGWNRYRSRPLPCDILVEHDVEIIVRDGARLYCDIYRSPNTGPLNRVPALLGFSPFGKKFSGICMLNSMTPWNVGVPDDHLSGLEKFEGLDPAEWIPRGYAIISADTRGTGDSDGPVVIMGTQEGEDGYDVVEALAKMDWCNGAVGMQGNSHLAITQYFVAMQQPPSLRAIAPWEACSDLFREQFGRGGMWHGDFFDYISSVFIQGYHGMEDFKEMYRRSKGLRNAYWDDKRPDLSKINIPTYLTGSYSSNVHVMGSIRGWLEIASENKWFRLGPWQEWYDLWVEENSTSELQRFFDRFLKDIDNGWEGTPRVRVTALTFGEGDPEYNLVVDDFPLPSTDYREFFFAPHGQLQPELSTDEGISSYDSTTMQSSAFRFVFEKDARLIGLPKAVIYMSCDDEDDMDVFVIIRKLDRQGKKLVALNIPWSRAPVRATDEIQDKDKSDLILYPGPVGMLRASHREIEPSRSIHPQYPFHPHERQLPTPRGQVVGLEIGLWAMGIDF
ncbi:alpha/beta-hydrolase [Aspergillus sclerotioniger CBS 115572]|uniref:Alpha/beta-hydrolase n=1 Tax=Aspergillus sclerotioniger CBS 115572 TaxID=1450535 RepID=A0A317W836_9EURO|nr:alpha/beta-hydrolase [Aspergillus sclerotioniger CBS 115572]PWY80310.1 alpha/beta-hydrolase [Aspergillus sclerotioniger CBS 115572]